MVLRFVLCLLLLAGCGEIQSPYQPTPAPASPESSSGAGPLPTSGPPVPVGAPQQIKDLTIALEAPPAPLGAQSQTWVVTLTDGAGQPVDGADVYLDLTMAAMDMGQNKPLATPQGGGRYLAQGVYGMGGSWQIGVHARVNESDYVASFPIEVAP